MFNSYYEINVSLNGRHYFATHPRSIQSERDLLKVYADFEKKFPKKDGYELGVTYHPSTAYGVKVNTNANQVINSIDDYLK